MSRAISGLAATFLATLAGLVIATGAVGFVAQAHASGGGGSGSISSAPVESRPSSPEKQAEVGYQKGLKHKAKAWKLEEKAASAKNERRRARELKRAGKEYNKAQEYFAEVLRAFPEHYKAANELGYVLRKQGAYEQAIGSYNYALQIFPEFLQAVEYRAEAFVAIGFYDEAREAYMRLFREDAKLAEELMVSMKAWAAEQEAPGARARNFIEWIESRENVSAFGELTESSSSGW